MNRKEAENYIYESYNRAVKYLDRGAPDSVKRHPELTERILARFPHTPCVAVTGSKGKGSVCTMITALMSEKVRTGLFTSPHVLEFNERFAVDGTIITDKEFADCVTRVKGLFDVSGPATKETYISPIGIQAAVALDFFMSKDTGFNVLECGKGARYDDVNNIPHEYAVITPIFLEHTRELGKTLREIAEDKACIIKKGMICAYTAAQTDEVMEVLEARAAECSVPLKVHGRDFRADNVRYVGDGIEFDLKVGEREYKRLPLPLLGSFQAENAALAVAVCTDVIQNMISDEIRKSGEQQEHESDGTSLGAHNCMDILEHDTIKRGLYTVSRPGRMEIIGRDPLVILDATINRKSCEEVKKALASIGVKKVVSVIAVPDDKDFEGVALEAADISAHIILSQSQNPHYVFTERQQEVLESRGLKNISRITDSCDAMKEAVTLAKKEGAAVLLLGTTSFVGEIKKATVSHDL